MDNFKLSTYFNIDENSKDRLIISEHSKRLDYLIQGYIVDKRKFVDKLILKNIETELLEIFKQNIEDELKERKS